MVRLPLNRPHCPRLPSLRSPEPLLCRPSSRKLLTWSCLAAPSRRRRCWCWVLTLVLALAQPPPFFALSFAELESCKVCPTAPQVCCLLSAVEGRTIMHAFEFDDEAQSYEVERSVSSAQLVATVQSRRARKVKRGEITAPRAPAVIAAP